MTFFLLVLVCPERGQKKRKEKRERGLEKREIRYTEMIDSFILLNDF